MWADAQRDGRPAKYRWCSESSVILFLVPRRKVWLTPAARVPCSNVANIERKTWTQSELCTRKYRQGAKALENVYIVYQPRRRPNIVQSMVNDVAL